MRTNTIRGPQLGGSIAVLVVVLSAAAAAVTPARSPGPDIPKRWSVEPAAMARIPGPDIPKRWSVEPPADLAAG